jgi:hypothetical protein
MNAQKLLGFNFHLAVWLSIIGGILVFNVPALVLPDPDGLYGPLRNNLLIVVGYLMIGQIGLWYFRYLRGSRIEALIMGFSFLLTAAGLKVYGAVNGLPINDLFTLALIYFGFSHVAYYFAKPTPADEGAGRGTHPRSRGSHP